MFGFLVLWCASSRHLPSYAPRRRRAKVSPSDIRILSPPPHAGQGASPARHGIARDARAVVGMPPPPSPTHAQHGTPAPTEHTPSHVSKLAHSCLMHSTSWHLTCHTMSNMRDSPSPCFTLAHVISKVRDMQAWQACWTAPARLRCPRCR